MDPYKKQFTVSDLVDAMPPGLNKNLMQNWFVRGVIQISDDSPGSGKKRLYSFYEALQVELVFQMTMRNEPTKVAGPVAKLCADFFCEWIKQGNDPGEYNDDEAHIITFTIHGKHTAKPGDRRLRYQILKKKNFNIHREIKVMYFKTLDFHYTAWRLYEALFDVTATKARQSGSDERGFPTDPNHPWHEG